MKCTVCTQHRQNPILKKLSDTGYPIHHVCIAEYFEKIGEKDMDTLCDTFNSVHMGYVLNLVQHSNQEGIDIDVPNPTEAPPIVVWAENSDKEANGGMFLLGSKFGNGEPVDHDELTYELYSKLKEVPSQAYSMAYNATMNQVNEDSIQSQFEKHNISESDWENYSHDKKLNTIKKWFGKPSEMRMEDYIIKGDAIVIQGQPLGTSFHYRAIGDIGEHNGIRYIKQFRLEDVTEDTKISHEEFNTFKDKVKNHFNNDDLFGKMSDQFKDFEEEINDEDTFYYNS